MVTNVYVQFNYDSLHTDKALGNSRKSDNNNNNKNKACSTLGAFLDPKVEVIRKGQQTVNGR